jgi:hypothetical protein
MLTQTWDTTADCTVALLLHYIFDLNGYSARELVERWLKQYPANWVRWAAIEALYQGRYKAVSVEQILGFWQRRGQALPRFNCEFERLVCGNIQPRIGRYSDRHPTASPSPLALKPAVYTTHSTQIPYAAKKAELVSRQPKLVQAVDVAPKPVPANKALNTSTSSQQNQPTSDRHSSWRRLSSALPNHTSQQPIQQFHPEKTKASDFYIKLKAISQHN